MILSIVYHYTCGKFCPIYGVIFQNFALVYGDSFSKCCHGLLVLALNFQRHLYTRPPIEDKHLGKVPMQNNFSRLNNFLKDGPDFF